MTANGSDRPNLADQSTLIPSPIPEMLVARKRSRAGCWTCKKRRIRCDEKHPACQRCTSTGRHCDGYPKLSTTKKAKLQPIVMMIVTDFERATYDPLINMHLQYFFHVSAPALRSHRTADFWNITVLQACQQVQCLRELAVAVGSIERSLRSNVDADSTQEGTEAHLMHYGRALKYMSTNQDVGTTLIGCLMLVLLEDLNRAPFAALFHIRAGLQLLRERPDIFLDSCLFDELRRVFSTLSEHQPELAAQYIRINSVYSFGPEKRSVFARLGLTASDRSGVFASLEHASYVLESLRRKCIIPPPDPRPLSRFHIIPGVTEELNDWLEDFNVFHSRLPYQQQEVYKCEIHAMRAHHLILKIVSCSAAQYKETWYDYYDQDLDGLVQKFAIMCELGCLNLSPLIFFVACKYRDVAGRRRAIDLLRYQINGWEGAILASVADKIVRLEEEGLDNPVTSGDIPESNRVRPKALIPACQATDQAAVSFLRAPFNNYARSTTVVLPASNASHNVASKNLVLQSAIQLIYSIFPEHPLVSNSVPAPQDPFVS